MARAESNTDFPSGKNSEFFDQPVMEPTPARAGSDTDFPNGKDTEFFGRPVTESVTALAGSGTDFPSGEYSEFFSRPVTESVTARAGSDTDFPSEEHAEFFGRPVTESVTSRAGSGTDFPSGEHSEFFSRPVTESVTARAGSDTDLPSDEHSEFFGRPVTKSVTAQAGSDTDFPNGEYSEFVDRPVTKSVTVRAADTEKILVFNVSTVATEKSELRTMVSGETDKRGIPVYSVECTPDSRHPENISAGALQHVEMSNKQRNYVNYCCNVCGKANSVNRSGTASCWNCCCLIVGGYRVSCVAAIVIKDRLYGINLFTEDRRVFTRESGIDNVMIKNNDPIDSRYHQRCADNGHRSLANASVRGKPIREKGRFGYLDTLVRDADWSAEYSVGVIPVGAIRIGYLRDPVDQRQSTDAAPLTKLLIFNTLLHFYNCCASRSAWNWTFCNTVWNNICVEELTRHCSDFSVCQTMSGAALVDDRSGATFDVELCIPWDAPEAVVDINSAAVSRILQGRDSRSVRFLVPDARGLYQNFHDVTIVDIDDEQEPTVTPADMTRLRELWPPEIFNHMRWFQQDLELMRKSAKREFSQLRPMPCKFCGKVIRVDMYRHVDRLHLDLVQLWRCPIAWCTTWKGSPQ